MHLLDGPRAIVGTVSDSRHAAGPPPSLRDAVPYGTSRCTLAPGESGRAERQEDLELSRVVTGKALVEVAGAIARLEKGEAVLFDSGETHVFHNRSTSEALVIFSIYWLALPAAGAPAPEAATA
jgi:mannose-6-phosphate isomerase-like protein (cupin superfamily)